MGSPGLQTVHPGESVDLLWSLDAGYDYSNGSVLFYHTSINPTNLILYHMGGDTVDAVYNASFLGNLSQVGIRIPEVTSAMAAKYICDLEELGISNDDAVVYVYGKIH